MGEPPLNFEPTQQNLVQRNLDHKKGTMAKVSGDLIVLYNEYQSFLQQGVVGQVFKPSNPLLRMIDGRVVIDAVASGDASALQADLEALGMQKAVRFGRIVSGQLPIEAIEDMASLNNLNFARPAYAKTNVGSATSQCNEAMRSDNTRATFGVDGTGIMVGTLSDSLGDGVDIFQQIILPKDITFIAPSMGLAVFLSQRSTWSPEPT